MVNQTAVFNDTVTANVTSDGCPRDPVLKNKDGELVWNRNDQGAALATFDYGFMITQVLRDCLAVIGER